MDIKANGRLFHHFHGTYWASIGLVFDNSEEVALALPLLGAGWKKTDNSRVLGWSGKSEELKACVEVLVSYGADEDKITSLKYSIDSGEAFEITMSVENPNQLALF